MAQIRLSKREKVGSRSSNALRDKGQIPGVIYGHGEGTQSVTLERHDLEVAIRHGERLLRADLDGQEKNLLIKEVQYDFLGQEIIHVDLTPVNLSDRVTVTVPVVLRGSPVGVSGENGVLTQSMQQVKVECLVTSIPDEVRVSVSNLHVGEQIRISDLVLAEGLAVLEDPEHVVASVSLVAEEVEAPAVEGATAEPEVIGAKPEEEAEGEEEKKK